MLDYYSFLMQNYFWRILGYKIGEINNNKINNDEVNHKEILNLLPKKSTDGTFLREYRRNFLEKSQYKCEKKCEKKE